MDYQVSASAARPGLHWQIKLLSFLFILGGLFLGFVAIGNYRVASLFGSASASSSLLLGILTVGMLFLIAIGLLLRKPWGRYLAMIAMVLSALLFLFAMGWIYMLGLQLHLGTSSQFIFSLLQTFLPALLISLAVLFYLILSPVVKETFPSRKFHFIGWRRLALGLIAIAIFIALLVMLLRFLG